MTENKEKFKLEFGVHFCPPGMIWEDSVEWEMRKASIAGEKGGVVFEQENVETPKDWSQLATNIVASKYFRGKLGSPERESSIKGLINRVVDTIVDYGVKNGYFANKNSASNYRNDLGYMLVHQMVSFNSPVWFNIGADNVKQQASACQPYNAIVNTVNGPMKIGDICNNNMIGLQVYDRTSVTEVIAVKMNGVKRVKRVYLNSGKTLDATGDHELLVRHKDYSLSWSLLDDLVLGEDDILMRDSLQLNDNEYLADKVLDVLDIGDHLVYDIQTVSGSYLSDNFVVHNCFILNVEDDMESILRWVRDEGMIFKWGSGSGVNLSKLRESTANLSGGGPASGPVSFMKIADTAAGVIKSGGTTRRAAKMVLLDVDHPDIEDFIQCKVKEEHKAKALIAQGYDSSFLGEAYGSVHFQNANNSVRVTDEFMKAVRDDLDWDLHSRGLDDGVIKTLKARDVFHTIAQATWECGDPGLQFTDTINKWHTVANTDKIYASNPCSEFLFLNNTACNLASFNLLKFYQDGHFMVNDFIKATRILITAMEILVGYADYPTEQITENSRNYRPLGLGYTNLGALLMGMGLPYDSDQGRTMAAAITSLLAGVSYHQSSLLAQNQGAFAGYEQNKEVMLKVIEEHLNAVYKINLSELKDKNIWAAAKTAWEKALELGQKNGYRNAQTVVIAPVGTISFMMDADTTGVEPDLALVKYKKLVGGGLLKMTNNSVISALQVLGYGEKDIEEVIKYIAENDTIEGCSVVRPQDLPVFDCAFTPAKGNRSIAWEGHIKMIAAIQPFLSGSVSKTVNLPRDATVEDIEKAYTMGWELGCKAIAVYRDGCKESQPLSTSLAQATSGASAVGGHNALHYVEKRRLPVDRVSHTHKFKIGENEGYLITGMYEDGSLGEVFVIMSKAGSSLQGFANVMSILISLALQKGVPLEDIVDKLSHTRFAPNGFTGDPKVPTASSLPDYIARWLAAKYLNKDIDQEANVAVPLVAAGPLEKPAVKEKTSSLVSVSKTTHDADTCTNCGAIMVRSGTCFTCNECGETSGCG